MVGNLFNKIWKLKWYIDKNTSSSLDAVLGCKHCIALSLSEFKHLANYKNQKFIYANRKLVNFSISAKKALQNILHSPTT
jgi:adenine specific DNA methylase Mod